MRKSGAAEPDGVDADEEVAEIGGNEGGDVFVEAGAPGDHGAAADAHELVEDTAAAEHGTFSDINVAGEKAVVGDDDVVGQGHVMSQVGADHEKAIASDGSGGAFFGAAMDGDVFAKAVAVADADFAVDSRRVCKILRCRADNAAVADEITFAHGDVFFDDRVGLHDATRTNGHVIADDGVRADLDIVAENGGRRDNRGGVDFHSRPESRKLKYGKRPSPAEPRMTWSMKLIWRRLDASRRAEVRRRSAALGWVSPLGWLWTRMNA